MPYDVAALIRYARQSVGGVPALATSIGSAEGGSVQRQHAEALAFWEAALALSGPDTLHAGERAVADAQITRHRAMLPPVSAMPVEERASRRRITEAV